MVISQASRVQHQPVPQEPIMGSWRIERSRNECNAFTVHARSIRTQRTTSRRMPTGVVQRLLLKAKLSDDSQLQRTWQRTEERQQRQRKRKRWRKRKISLHTTILPASNSQAEQPTTQITQSTIPRFITIRQRQRRTMPRMDHPRILLQGKPEKGIMPLLA